MLRAIPVYALVGVTDGENVALLPQQADNLHLQHTAVLQLVHKHMGDLPCDLRRCKVEVS